MHGKLKMSKEHIKRNIYGQDDPYDMHSNATVVFKIDYIYKQSKNYHPKVSFEKYKHTDAESQQCSFLSDLDDDEYFVV